MANDCLVSTVKAATNNELLPHFGYGGFIFKADSPTTIFNDAQLGVTQKNTPLLLNADGYFVDNNNVNIGKLSYNHLKQSGNHLHINTEVLLEIPYYKDGDEVASEFPSLPGVHWDLDINEWYDVYEKARVQAPITLVPDNMYGDINKILSKCVASTITITPNNSSPNVTGNINSVVMEDRIWIYTMSFANMPNISGDIETILNQAAAKADYGGTPSSHHMTFKIKDCPGLKYKNVSTGTYPNAYFEKEFIITESNTWSEV